MQVTRRNTDKRQFVSNSTTLTTRLENPQLQIVCSITYTKIQMPQDTVRTRPRLSGSFLAPDVLAGTQEVRF